MRKKENAKRVLESEREFVKSSQSRGQCVRYRHKKKTYDDVKISEQKANDNRMNSKRLADRIDKNRSST